MKEKEICIEDNEYSNLMSSSFDYTSFIFEQSIKSHLHTSEIKKIGGYSISEFVCVNVEDMNFAFNRSLKHIAAQIEEAKEILSYPENWDDENGDPTDLNTFLKASNFLYRYSSYIEQNYGVVISSPYMDILKDGSIYLNWEKDNAKFIIIFKKNNNPLAYFYSERIDKKGNKIPFKGAIEIDGEVDEIFGQWMKTYLIQ